MDCVPYSKLAAHYDSGWGDFAESSREFVLNTLLDYGVEAGRILELACGTGILAIHLARAGHAVVGIDRSPEMIAYARMRGTSVRGVEFAVADMRDVNIAPTFDAVLCLFDSINYLLTLDDLSKTLESVSSMLQTNGVFIFDFNRPLIYSAHNGEILTRQSESGILLMELQYEVITRISHTIFRFPDGDVETHTQRAYELRDMEPLLNAADLSLCECYSDFSGRAVSSAAERLICVCQRA